MKKKEELTKQDIKELDDWFKNDPNFSVKPAPEPEKKDSLSDQFPFNNLMFPIVEPFQR